MTATKPFVGTNTRSLAQFLNQKNSDIEFIKNPKNGHIFAVLTSLGENVSVSANAQDSIIANGLGSLADYQVCDMPGTNKDTGMPDGTVFTLITLKGTNNSLGTLCR